MAMAGGGTTKSRSRAVLPRSGSRIVDDERAQQGERLVVDVASQGGERVRAAEVMAALSLATDLGIVHAWSLEDTLSRLWQLRLTSQHG
jgi:hypothetical protein